MSKDAPKSIKGDSTASKGVLGHLLCEGLRQPVGQRDGRLSGTSRGAVKDAEQNSACVVLDV